MSGSDGVEPGAASCAAMKVSRVLSTLVLPPRLDAFTVTRLSRPDGDVVVDASTVVFADSAGVRMLEDWVSAGCVLVNVSEGLSTTLRLLRRALMSAGAPAVLLV